MNGVYFYNSPRIERARRLKCRRQRIENIKTFVKAIVAFLILYGFLWLYLI